MATGIKYISWRRLSDRDINKLDLVVESPDGIFRFKYPDKQIILTGARLKFSHLIKNKQEYPVFKITNTKSVIKKYREVMTKVEKRACDIISENSVQLLDSFYPSHVFYKKFMKPTINKNDEIKLFLETSEIPSANNGNIKMAEIVIISDDEDISGIKLQNFALLCKNSGSIKCDLFIKYVRIGTNFNILIIPIRMELTGKSKKNVSLIKNLTLEERMRDEAIEEEEQIKPDEVGENNAIQEEESDKKEKNEDMKEEDIKEEDIKEEDIKEEDIKEEDIKEEDIKEEDIKEEDIKEEKIVKIDEMGDGKKSSENNNKSKKKDKHENIISQNADIISAENISDNPKTPNTINTLNTPIIEKSEALGENQSNETRNIGGGNDQVINPIAPEIQKIYDEIENIKKQNSDLRKKLMKKENDTHGTNDELFDDYQDESDNDSMYDD
jgi:hypothetical protein